MNIMKDIGDWFPKGTETLQQLSPDALLPPDMHSVQIYT
jgi:hypothetical protein